MALSSSNYYSKSIQGTPGAGADVDVTAVHSAPKYALGYLIERADGARYRYCYVGTATNAGNLVGQTQSSGGAVYGAAVVVAPASAVVAFAGLAGLIVAGLVLSRPERYRVVHRVYQTEV